MVDRAVDSFRPVAVKNRGEEIEKDAEQSNARDFGPLSPIFTYSSRITVWWQLTLGCPS
jgi:hypothetical protein